MSVSTAGISESAAKKETVSKLSVPDLSKFATLNVYSVHTFYFICGNSHEFDLFFPTVL